MSYPAKPTTAADTAKAVRAIAKKLAAVRQAYAVIDEGEAYDAVAAEILAESNVAPERAIDAIEGRPVPGAAVDLDLASVDELIAEIGSAMRDKTAAERRRVDAEHALRARVNDDDSYVHLRAAAYEVEA
jgi:altronate dehydratase